VNHKISSKRAIRHLVIASVLAISLVSVSTSPAAAISLGEYFDISYNFVFSDTEIQGNEVFYCTVTGTATCIKDIKDLGFPYNLVNGVRFTFCVVGEPQAGGDPVTLNPSYTIPIDPLPEVTETAPINEVIPLQFPEESESGVYDVRGELTTAEANTAFGRWNVTDQIPPEYHTLAMDGPVTYTAPPNNPPNTPSKPSPANHATGVSINADLSWSGGDPDAEDTVTYDVYFGTSDPPPSVSNHQTGTTYDPGTLSYDTEYYWKIIATDNHGASIASPLWDFTTQAALNNPPNTPSAPSGPESGYAGISYDYSTSASDPDSGQVKYTFDWGDGTTSETGFVDSGAIVSQSHSWSSPGTYSVKAKATDNNGASSGWSDSRTVAITTPQEQEMHIASIDMGLKSGESWFSKYTYATATVTIVDSKTNPVKGAKVSGHWSHATADSDSGVTGSDGKITFRSDSRQSTAKGATFTFTVGDVTKSGWTYDPDVNFETSDSITVTPGSPGGFLSHILWLVKQFIQKIRSIFSQAISS